VPDNNRSRGIRLRELRLAGATGSNHSYGVSFLDESHESWRPLSVIAGPSQTGKTSVLDFVRYCLGDSDHPQHPEVLTYVRAALLETTLADNVTTIERAATGPASKFASVWQSTLSNLADTRELRLATEPPSEPDSLSQFVLAACDLDNIALPVAPTKAESDTQILSIRDLFRVMWLPNERLDSKNLVFEHSQFMVQQKLLQTIDVIFDVHNAAGTDLAARARQAADAAREAQRVVDSLRTIVQAEYPSGLLALEADRGQAQRDIQMLRRQLTDLDRNQVSAENTLTGLRKALESAQNDARAAAVRVRNRESLMDRLAALRGQYADDKKKLTFLKEAERLFNPLQVMVCPACLSALEAAPEVIGGACSLCGHTLPYDYGELTLGAAADGAELHSEPDLTEDVGLDDALAVLEAEHKATTRRLDELTDYWNRLDDDLKILRAAQDAADRAVEQTAVALNRAADVPAPYLVARDNLNRRLADALVREQVTETGMRLWTRLQTAEDNARRLAGQAAQLRAERRETSNRPDRAGVVARLSRRFGEILSDIGYPKLSQPYLDSRLAPFVRGLPYTNASSGGLVLISLAWYLAIWEVAYEQAARAPGLLMIDSPQKNLGHSARADDPDFADTRLVENFYRHVQQWLRNVGVGAQLVIIDNSPPEFIADDVVIRYTRNRTVPPYGLIDNATD
jgi:hypothetical protein